MVMILHKDGLEWVVFGLECSLMVGNRFGPIVRGLRNADFRDMSREHTGHITEAVIE